MNVGPVQRSTIPAKLFYLTSKNSVPTNLEYLNLRVPRYVSLVPLVDMQAQAARKTPKLSLSQACEKCSQDMCVSVAPHLLHAASNALCHMRVDGCVPVDVLPCWFGAQCDSCGAPAAMRHVQVCPHTPPCVGKFVHFDTTGKGGDRGKPPERTISYRSRSINDLSNGTPAP